MGAHGRLLLLLLLLSAAAWYYVHHTTETPATVTAQPPADQDSDKSGTLPLDEETKADIRRYFAGVTIELNENNLNEAIRLDHSVGRPQLAEGRYRDAFRTYQKILAISYQQGSLMGIGIALMILGDTADRADQMEESLTATLLAYKIAQTMNNPEEMGVAELSMAKKLRTSDPDLSVGWLLRAKEHLKNSRYVEDYLRALPSFADHLRRENDNSGAIAALSEAWGLARTLGQTPTQKWAQWEIAIDYANDLAVSGQHEAAIAITKEAQGFFSSSEKQSDAYTSLLYRLASSSNTLGRMDDAERYYLSSYATYELTRAEAPGEEGRAQLDRNHKGLVDAFVQFQLDLKDVPAALALLESNKARTLNEIVEDPAYKDTQGQWKAMERTHAAEFATLLEGADDPLSPLPRRHLLKQVLSLQQRQEDERRQWQIRFQLRDMTVTKNLSKEHIEQIRQRLPRDTGVISFFTSDDHAGIFVMSRQSLRYVPLAVDLAEYRRAIQQLRVALTNPHNDFYREPAQWLYQSVLAPGMKLLPKNTKVLVYSPDGLLSGIPLEVFMDGDRFLGERLALYRVPSLRYATAIGEVTAPPAARGIACVDPDISGSRLPFQQETGQIIKTLYGKHAVTLVGTDCSEQNLLSALQHDPQPTFLHIGAHGVFYPSDAMDSKIWLSADDDTNRQGQEWSARAMTTVDMRHVDLVTLSSCETGLSDPKFERDVFGISRALFFAGAKRVVAPLWAIHDRSTAEFMRELHTAYARKMPAVHALQRAQLAFISGKRYRHPFYWSAFVLTGATQ